MPLSAVALLHPSLEKNPCPRMQPGHNPGDLARGLSRYEEFHQGLKPDKIQRIRLNKPKALVKMGIADRIYYTREEPDGPQAYYHDFGEESGRKPVLATTPDGKQILIFGGGFRVKDWIYD